MTAADTLADSPASGRGYMARERREARSANPYRVGTLDYTAWQRGWDMADDDLEMTP